MENRIDRKNDEGLYQPKIHSERIRLLYQIKQATGKPMTVLLDEAVREFAASHGAQSPLEDMQILQSTDKETWEEICEYRRSLHEWELNENLQKYTPEGMKDFSIEWIAERVGINRSILYEWVKTDAEFIEAPEQLKDVQENDPFKTGTEEDTFVNSMTIALLLLETKQRQDEP